MALPGGSENSVPAQIFPMGCPSSESARGQQGWLCSPLSPWLAEPGVMPSSPEGFERPGWMGIIIFTPLQSFSHFQSHEVEITAGRCEGSQQVNQVLLNPALNPYGTGAALSPLQTEYSVFSPTGFCEILFLLCPNLFLWSITSVWSLPHTPLPCQTTAFTCVFRCFPCDPSCGSASWATPDFSQRSVAPMVKMTRSKTFQAYLPSCHRTYSCIHCRAHLANHDELISKVGVPLEQAVLSRCTSVALEVLGLLQLLFFLGKWALNTKDLYL